MTERIPGITADVLELEDLCFSLAQQPVHKPLWLELNQVWIILPYAQNRTGLPVI
jgi:hypothetical protein